jgi:hypothetical protein
MWQSSNIIEQTLTNQNCMHEEIKSRLNSGNVLYGCETWSLTLSEKHRLRMFQNSVLRRIFGPKRAEETGEWRKLHNGELHNWYSSPNIIKLAKSRRTRWAGHVACMGAETKVYKVLVGKPEGNRPLRRQA